MSARRYTRQVRLAEVGEPGQARLAAAAVELEAASDLGRVVEERYLRAAGVGRVAGPVRAPSPPPVDLGLRHPAAREVGEGALAALATLRRLLGVDGR